MRLVFIGHMDELICVGFVHTAYWLVGSEQIGHARDCCSDIWLASHEHSFFSSAARESFPVDLVRAFLHFLDHTNDDA